MRKYLSEHIGIGAISAVTYIFAFFLKAMSVVRTENGLLGELWNISGSTLIVETKEPGFFLAILMILEEFVRFAWNTKVN